MEQVASTTSDQIGRGQISSVNPPPPKPMKPPRRRLTPAEKAVMLEKRRNSIPEFLGPLVDTPDEGRKMYENYEISVENGIYTCATCGFMTGPTHHAENWRRLQVIKMHVKAKHLNAYRCHLCEKNFTTHKCHQLHLQKMHPPEILLQLCNLCGKSVANIDAHLWSHKSPEEKAEVVRSGKGYAIIPCDKCGKEFEGFDKLAAHQTMGFRCKKGSEIYMATGSEGGSSGRKLPCPTCEKLVFLVNLAQHEWTHKNSEEREESVRLGTAPMTRCEICDKFVIHTYLRKHLEMHKKPEERAAYFRCGEEGCGRKFWKEEDFIRHGKAGHQGVVRDKEEILLRCPDPACSSRRFTTPGNLQDHIGRRHKFKVRAERPFKCEICLDRFLIRNDLTKHLKDHLPRAEYTLTCPHCPVLFARPKALRRHLTLEHAAPRESKTEQCRKYQAGKKALGERPFKCSICRAGFFLKKDLNVHLKHHRPEEDFTLTCLQCPVLFAHSASLRKHLTGQHSLPRETNAEKEKRYREERKKRESSDKGYGNNSSSSSGRMTRSRTKRAKIEFIPDEEIEIKEEDYTIRDVLSNSEGDTDDPSTNYGTNVDEIKSEDEESYGDLETMTMMDDEEVEVKIEADEGSDLDQEEVKVEHDDDDPGDVDLDESEFLFDYDDFYPSSDLEMRDPLKEIDDDDESAFCITPNVLKGRKEGPNKISSARPPENQSSPLEKKATKTPKFNLTCPTCEKKFPRKSRLLHHVERCRLMACTVPTCSSKFTSEKAMKAHIKSAHPGVPAFACVLCGYKFSEANKLGIHMVTRHETGDKKFSCDKCAKSFALQENFQRHVDLHKIETEKPIVCNVCDSRFEDDTRLQRHAAMHKRVNCDQCEVSFPGRKSLERHIRLVHMEKQEKCDHCEASFIDKAALARHVGLVHTSHVCHICGKSFPLRQALKTHLKRHDESRRVTCETCGEKFKGHMRLKSHRIQKHGGDPLVCDECGATFSSPMGFAHHMMVHRDEKPHKCDLCEARFVIKILLENHRRTHTGERPFSCPHCEFAFKARKELVTHIKKIHTPGYVPPIRHRCSHCEKGFEIGSLLEAHVRQVHTGERPFACDQTDCGKAFAQKRALVLHLRKTHKIGEQKTRFKLPSRKGFAGKGDHVLEGERKNTE